jgi:hypothetical protein
MQGQQFRRTGKVSNGVGGVKVGLGFWLLLLFWRCKLEPSRTAAAIRVQGASNGWGEPAD